MSEDSLTLQPTGGDTDLALVRAIARGDQQALQTLYIRQGPGLLAYLVGQLGDRSLAEEVLQDVMLAVWHGAARFRGESQVRTWLLSIARYQAINRQRRRRLPQVSLDRAGPLASSEDPQARAVQSSQQQGLENALARLPDDQRESLELVFYHGLSGSEVAAVQGVALGTVKSRLHRAKAALRKLLQVEDLSDA